MDLLYANQPKRKMKLIFSVLIIFPLFCIYGIVNGVPAIGHYFASRSDELILTVSRKSFRYYNRLCNGRIEFQEYHYYFNEHICGIRYIDWKAIRSDDKLILKGNNSIFGFSMKDYQIVKQENYPAWSAARNNHRIQRN